MEYKNKIEEIFRCNRSLYKILYEQQKPINMSLGFSLFKIIGEFDKVEEYVFSIMENVFGNDIDYNNLTEDQRKVYMSLMLTDINVNYEKISREEFLKGEEIIINMEDIENIQIILS